VAVASFKPIDYVGLAAALLQRIDELVARWLPHGVERNARWYVGDFDGGSGESANVNLVTGQWIDNAAPDEDKGGVGRGAGGPPRGSAARDRAAARQR
jgi:hypothetical protein